MKAKNFKQTADWNVSRKWLEKRKAEEQRSNDACVGDDDDHDYSPDEDDDPGDDLIDLLLHNTNSNELAIKRLKLRVLSTQIVTAAALVLAVCAILN